MWRLWEGDAGGMPIQVTASTKVTYIVTSFGRIYGYGSDALMQGTIGYSENAGYYPQVGVTQTRMITRVHASEDAIFGLSDLLIEAQQQQCDASAQLYPLQLARQSNVAISLFGYGLGNVASNIQVVLTLPDSSTLDCVPSTLLVDSKDARKRQLTCFADFSNSTAGDIYAKIFLGNEVSNSVLAGTLVPAPTINPSTTYGNYSIYADSATTFQVKGSGFGGCGASLSVSLLQGTRNTDCVIRSASETQITCSTVSGLQANLPVTLVVSRGGGVVQVSQWARIVASPFVNTSLTSLPNNVDILSIRGGNFASDLSVMVRNLPCGVINQTATLINCWIGNSFSNYTGYAFAVVFSYGGSSGDPVAVASFVDPPKAEAQNKSIASGAQVIAIRGIRFGSAAELTVTIFVEQNSSKRAASQFPCNVTGITIDESTLSGEETLTCVVYAPSGLPAGSASAQVQRNGGSSSVIQLGSVVPNPSITTSSVPTRSRTVTVVRIPGNNFAPLPNHLQNTVTLSNATCTITNATRTEITCSVVAPLVGSVLTAEVRTFGASTGVLPILNLIDPPRVNSSTQAFAARTTSLAITGSNFEGPSAVVTLFLNARTASCRPLATSDNSTVVCSVDETVLDEIGSIFVVVDSFGGSSERTQIGVIDRTSNGTSSTVTTGGLDTSAVIGIAVAAVAFVVIALAIAVIVVRRYKHNQDIKLRDAAMKISEEAKGLFNIKASELSVISKLGEGSFGAVYLGKYKGQHVAIKRLATNVLANQINDFFREAAVMLSQKKHRNVVHFMGMCQEQANFSMVMEFLPNGDLLGLASRTIDEQGSPLSDRTLWKILRGVALGMAALASQGIVHRDLAARNILLDQELEPRVSDFGFSRNVGDQGQGKTQSSVGPVKWMAPEALRDRTYSEKSDVWSFGCLVYEIVSGQSPFPGEDLLVVAVKVRDTGINCFEASPPAYKYPSYLNDVMKMCFASEPNLRPTFQMLVEFFDTNIPAGLSAPPRGAGWLIEDVLQSVRPSRRDGKANESSEEKSSIWEEDSSGEELTKIKTNYMETV